MAAHQLPELEGTSLVLIGSFNPRIFHPAWFAKNKLIADGSGASANVEIVNNEICVFETDWFRLEVISDKLALSSQTAPAVGSLRDLLLGTLRILRHTPVQRVGLNTHTHYRLQSERGWPEFGHKLAPKPVLWDPILKSPGTLSLVIQGERPDEYDGHIRVKVEPSSLVENGIFIETNDEFRMLSSDSAEWVERVLSDQWEMSRRRAQDAQSHLLQYAMEEVTG